MVTPLLSRLRENGGTLYTFPSATRDLARVFTNNSYTFTFSHFACLNIPDISDLSLLGEKKLQPTELRYDYRMAEQLQNYVMNYETAILNGEGDDDGYDNSVIRTVSERVFFNWFRKVGGINFVNSGTGDSIYYERCYLGYDGSDSDEDEDYVTFNPSNLSTHSEYVSRRAVKYIGKIDTVNTVEINGDTYSELYLHIPSGVGASYEVRFGGVTDNNYDGGYCTVDGDNDDIIGCDSATRKAEAELNTQAIYDWDAADDEGNSDDYNNTYIGDTGFFIDFRDSFYNNSMVGYSDIMSMNELSPDDFEFNAILIYYTYADASTGNASTNLYGILFLDNYTDNEYIQRYPKHKTTNLSPGNSFAFKVDIKIDAYPTSNMTAYYDTDNYKLLDYFQLYTDAMTKLQQTLDTFTQQQNEILELQDRVKELESLFFGIDTYQDMYARMKNLEDTLSGSGLADQEALTELISEVNNRITALASGNTPVEVQYNTDVLQDGYGIKMVKNSSDGKISVNSTLNSYSINDIYAANEESGEIVVDESSQITEENPVSINYQSPTARAILYTELEEGNNLAVIYVDGDVCTNDVYVYIDDTDVSWKAGQTLKLKFKSFIDFDSYSLHIYTGLVGTTYKQNINIAGDEIPYIPTIEIICKDTVMNQTESSFIYEVTSTDIIYAEENSSSASTGGGTAEPIGTSTLKNMINNEL